ncbi:MAG TPA: radical SAM family heme chaperone HemW, partial [Leptolinea sp.]
MNTSLYFHIPFCTRRCGYCDFVTYAGFERLLPAYIDALQKQVQLLSRGQPVHTIYFGGGTPSLVAVSDYQKLFNAIHSGFNVQNLAEISLEANPGTVDQALLDGYRKIGFNRISFGMQSALQNELTLLDRAHLPIDVERAVKFARNAGFENLNLDLIFGLPNQTLHDWQYSLEFALDLLPEHLSLYSLIVEVGTPLAARINQGLLPEPDEDIAAEQYDWSCHRLNKAGFSHYEISNWSKKHNQQDLRCQHNLQYWRLLPYFGFGCGAVGFLPASSHVFDVPTLMHNERTIGRFIQTINSAFLNQNSNQFLTPVSLQYEMETRLFVGFRL